MNHADQISEHDFRRLKGLIESHCGIALAPAKRVMLETRLRKRIAKLGLNSFAAYCDFLGSAEGQRTEWPVFIHEVTTHKTDFFREPAHFDFLTRQALPELVRRHGAGTHRPLLVWSAACSTGEEPYTLAMVLARHAESAAPDRFQFQIEATDISAPVLETARAAIYPAAEVDRVPVELRRKYLLRSKDRERAVVRMTPEIRASIRFRQLNLADSNYGFGDAFDVVLCRNVMIYFDRAMQQRVVDRIRAVMRRGGYLLMGHSESLNGIDAGLTQVAPTVYRRLNE